MIPEPHLSTRDLVMIVVAFIRRDVDSEIWVQRINPALLGRQIGVSDAMSYQFLPDPDPDPPSQTNHIGIESMRKCTKIKLDFLDSTGESR